jgi:ribosome-associated protein
LTQTQKNIHTSNSHPSAFELASLAATLAESKKASDTLVLDTGTVSCLADYFVICSGDSAAQIRTIAEEIKKAFRTQGQEPAGSEQDSTNKWHLLDYGDVVIHVMQRAERQFYQLEHFWNHATPIPPESWHLPLQQAS